MLFVDDGIQLCFLLTLNIFVPFLAHVSTLFRCHLVYEFLYQFTLVPHVRAGINLLSDLHNDLLVLTVRILIALYQLQYVVDVYLVVAYQLYLKDDVIVDGLFVVVVGFAELLIIVEVPTFIVLVVHLADNLCLFIKGVKDIQHVPQSQYLAQQANEFFFLFFVQNVAHLLQWEIP